MPPRVARAALFALASLLLPRPHSAYSSLAGTCEHAGVMHGFERVAPQPGDGGYTLALGHPGVNVPGATVPVVLTNADPAVAHKGMLVFATTVAGGGDDPTPLGSWDAAAMPDGCQIHPSCAYAATHDAFHNRGAVTDALPWIVPVDLAPGAVVTFKVTVVRDYDTWFAFERSFEVGSEAGAGSDDATRLAKESAAKESDGSPGAPGSKKSRAPSLGKAVEGGWRAPKTNDADGSEGSDAAANPKTEAKTKKPSAASSSAKRDAALPRGTREPAPATLGLTVEREVAAVEGARRPSSSGGGGGRKADAGARGARAAPTKTAAAAADPPLTPARARRRFARVAHGVTMAFCWLALAPLSASVARYGKTSDGAWFSFHRAVGAAVAITTAGSALFILRERGFDAPWGPHGRYGLFVVFLVALQVAGGYARKRFPRREWARWHAAAGVMVTLVGAYNCVVGAGMLGSMEGGAFQKWGGVARGAAGAWGVGLLWLERRRAGRMERRRREKRERAA